MEAMLRKQLATTTFKSFGSGGGGCISHGQGYLTDQGKVFVKMNHKPESRVMFEGEMASLDAILSTGTIKAPKPIKVLDNPDGGSVLVMEYLDIHGLARTARALGINLARMHLYNQEIGKKQAEKQSSIHEGGDGCNGCKEYVSKFGFHTTTCCGIIPQDNTWCESWVEFFCRCKIQLQIDLIVKDMGDREAPELWKQLLPKVPKFFAGIDIKPSLLHGDLWGGNVGEVDGEPVIFDPASMYGHHEFELSICNMFGGFNKTFANAYHELIPKEPGFETRQELYKLFHYLNHWNHFGGGYRGQSISIMRRLLAA